MLLLRLALAALAAYLLGSIPTGVLIARLFGWPDPRRHGSGHTGALNTLRGAGLPGGALVLLLDAAKGAGAVLLAGLIAPTPWAVPLAGMAATAGHIWPVWLDFEGGMGLATGTGAIAVYYPLAVLIGLALFGLARAFLARHRPRAVAVAALTLPPVLFALGLSPPVFWLGTGIALIVALRHLSEWNAGGGMIGTAEEAMESASG